jgi:hypothetical protein
MSAANSLAAKAQRRAEREARHERGEVARRGSIAAAVVGGLLYLAGSPGIRRQPNRSERRGGSR